MITCSQCKYIYIDEDRLKYLCRCNENCEKKFDAVSGEYKRTKDENFHKESNKKGNCPWFEPKKQKWWKKKKKYNFTPFENDRVDEFLAFVREKRPEVIIEFEFIKDSLKRSK